MKGELSLDRLVLFSHDISPDNIELIEDLRDASFRHLSLMDGLELFDFLDRLCWDPFVGISHILVFGFSLANFGLDSEGVANVANALLRQVFGFSHDFYILEVLVI